MARQNILVNCSETQLDNCILFWLKVKLKYHYILFNESGSLSCCLSLTTRLGTRWKCHLIKHTC
jgi:hypothetical protein